MVNEDNASRDKSNKKMTLVAVMVAVAVAIILLLIWVFFPNQPVEPKVSTPGIPQETLPEPAPEPEPQPEPEPAPVEPAAPAQPEEPPAEPLPALGESDQVLLEDIQALSSSDNLAEAVARDDLIRKTVRAVTALEEGALVNKYRPMEGPREPFVAEPVGQPANADEPQQYRLTEETYDRYNPYINALVHIQPADLAALYNRYYPLLEEAFAEQGVEKGNFREVTLQAIDQMLAAPIIEEEILLVRPSVMYKFADPDLEALPAAQKLMIRMGPENARKLKNVLRHLRTALEE